MLTFDIYLPALSVANHDWATVSTSLFVIGPKLNCKISSFHLTTSFYSDNLGIYFLDVIFNVKRTVDSVPLRFWNVFVKTVNFALLRLWEKINKTRNMWQAGPMRINIFVPFAFQIKNFISILMRMGANGTNGCIRSEPLGGLLSSARDGIKPWKYR